MSVHHSFSGPSSCTLHSSFGVSFHHASHISSILSGEKLFPDLGTQISISREHVIVRISLVRYHPFLLVDPPLETFSEVCRAFSPFGLIPFNLVPCRSRKSVVSWDCRSVPTCSPETPRGGLTNQIIQSFSSVMIFFALSCLPGGMPSQNTDSLDPLTPLQGLLSSFFLGID